MPRGGSSKPLRGYVRVPRSHGGGWRSPSDVRITEYEYRNRVAKKQGWKSAYESDKFRKSQTWKKWVMDIAQTKVNYEVGPHGEEIYVGPDLTYRGSLMRDAYEVRRLDVMGEPIRPDVAQPMEDTEIGRLLIASGRRPADAWWGAGDTPK